MKKLLQIPTERRCETYNHIKNQKDIYLRNGALKKTHQKSKKTK